MSVKYREFSGLHLPSIEKEMLAKWNETNAFEKSVHLRTGAPSFVFYEGPPSANGMPGIHHVISRTIKDLICRYKTMKGFQVNRKGGWDTHGLPVELGVEKELGITKEDIGKTISVEAYNRKCREAVLRFKSQWDDLTVKMGYWVDLNDPYITFKNEYIETLWWLLKQLHNKGLLYKSVSIQPYSPAAGTGLSSHELNQPGTYKDVKDTSATAIFSLSKEGVNATHPTVKKIFDVINNAQFSILNSQLGILAWTTTPWTLPSNLGLTVGANIDYALVQTFNPYTHQPQNVILAKALLHKYFKPEGEIIANDLPDFKGEKGEILPWKIVAEYKGSELEGIEYEQLMPFEANKTDNPNSFKILLGDFVTTEDGTGIVHTAPAFGADDYRIGKKYDIGILIMVDREGKFVEGMGAYSGRYVKDYKDEKNYTDVNVDICVELKKNGKAFRVEKYEHSYPHCWRTDKPILYYPLDAWFIKTTALRDRMVELNKTINWKPKSTGEGRFGNWLENMVDWNLSRSRYWGTPLPVWSTQDGSEQKCIGSIQELKEEILKAQQAGICKTPSPLETENGEIDLHKPYVDEVILLSDSGKPMYREPDLIDVWFDSGAMPYAQWGLDYEKLKNPNEKFPFAEGWDGSFPADFICEGVDQTRGWFYTLHAIASLVFDNVAFKSVVSNGLVLDKNGNKMSKRLGNAIDPFDTIDKYGADATRWYLITNASPWDNLKFDVEGIREVQRKFFGTLYNTYQFFALYANVDGFTYEEDSIPPMARPEIDRWILSSLHTLVKKVNQLMDDYELTQAGRLIEEFVDEHLSNWYVRLCRRRFWKGEYGEDKLAAYQTLYECLDIVCLLMAPIAPFFSDAIFSNLNSVTKRDRVESVHHADFPFAWEFSIDPALEERMQLAQDASSLILSLRKKVNIKVRQPLQKVLIPALNQTMKEQLQKMEDLIKSEVNVKEIEYLNPDNSFISKKIKPNFVALGKKLGAKMKSVAAALAQFSQENISELERESVIELDIDGEKIPIKIDEVEISSEDIPGWTVASKGSLTVALDVTITPHLQQEGDAREFVNRIQKIRKDSGFELTDKINVQIATNDTLKSSLIAHKQYICAEILADALEFLPSLKEGIDIEVNDNQLQAIVIKKR
jgi:isoleucyl-tRNA synthetase